MTTATFYANTADGYLQSRDDSYSLARAGTGASLGSSASATTAYVGQANDGAPGFVYGCFELFLSFDTSSIPDGAGITSVTLSLYGETDASATNFTINARAYDWGASLTTADWIAGASLSGNTLLATFATSGFSVAGYNDFTSEAAFRTAINKTGTTYIVLSSSRHEGNNTPTGAEYVKTWTANETGTSKDPKLTVVYSEVTGPLVGGRLVGGGALAGRLVV